MIENCISLLGPKQRSSQSRKTMYEADACPVLEGQGS